MPKLYDTHCHVNFNAYKDDAEAVIGHMRERGIMANVVGSQSTTSARAVEYAKLYPDVLRAIVGLHPMHLWESYHDEIEMPFRTREETFNRELYHQLASDSTVVGIGETGLDYFRLPEGKEEVLKSLQKETFIAQLKLAQELDLPVSVHTRSSISSMDAYEDVAEILAQHAPARKGVMHCYVGTPELAQRFIAMGFYISISGIVTFKNSGNVGDVALRVPLEHLVIETDAPYLTPEPNRGQRNEPSYVEHTARKIAELKGITYEEVARVTTENAAKLFSPRTD